MSAGPTVSPTARPPNRLVHPVLEPHDGRAQEPNSGEKHEPASDIDTAAVDSLKALDPNRPIREADIRQKNEEADWGQAASKRTSQLGTEGDLSGKNSYATSVAYSRVKARRSSSSRR